MTKKKQVGYVYRINCDCGCNKFYVGSTIRPINVRFQRHKSSALYGSNMKLHRHMREVGVSHFSISLLKKLVYSVSRPNYRHLVEDQFINSLDTIDNGYNTNHASAEYMWNQRRTMNSTPMSIPIRCGICPLILRFTFNNYRDLDLHDTTYRGYHTYCRTITNEDHYRINMFTDSMSDTPSNPPLKLITPRLIPLPITPHVEVDPPQANWEKFLVYKKEKYDAAMLEYTSLNDTKRAEAKVPKSEHQARELYNEYRKWRSKTDKTRAISETKFFTLAKPFTNCRKTKGCIMYDISSLEVNEEHPN